jgi:hypothetical protein
MCYRFAPRQSVVNVAVTESTPHGDERRTHTISAYHQTFTQLLYGIHRDVGRLFSFYTHQDDVEITETSLEGSTHVVTLETYGSVVYNPDAPLEVTFRCVGQEPD